MKNSPAVRVFGRARDLCHQLQTLPRFATKRRRRVMQASACREFHAEKRKPVLALAHLVNWKNIWMIEACCCFGFAPETLARLVRIGVVT